MARSNRQRKATFQACGKRECRKTRHSAADPAVFVLLLPTCSYCLRSSFRPASVPLPSLGPVLVSTILAQYVDTNIIKGLSSYLSPNFMTFAAFRSTTVPCSWVTAAAAFSLCADSRQ
jgi:hypothetical protein